MIDLADIDHTLIFFASFLALFLTFKPTLRAKSTCGAFLLACALVASDFHFYLAGLLLPENMNPQYVTVAFYLMCSATLCVRLFRAEWRSIERILLFAASVSVGVTAFLFHYILVIQTLPAWSKDGAWSNAYLTVQSQDHFPTACKEARLVCWSGAELVGDDLRVDIRQQVLGIHSFFQATAPESENGHGFGIFNDLTSDGVAVVLYYARPGDIRVIIDSRTGMRIHSSIRDSFYLLSTMAHSIWLAGALFLIWFHKRRFRRARNVD